MKLIGGPADGMEHFDKFGARYLEVPVPPPITPRMADDDLLGIQLCAGRGCATCLAELKRRGLAIMRAVYERRGAEYHFTGEMR